MFFYQRTIANSISCSGIGLHSGEPVTITFLPAPEDTGIVFRRVDVNNKSNLIAANYLNVKETTLCTALENKDGVRVSTIEHLMAAFWGCGIDNCIIEINGSEVPIMDGSSEQFVFILECAGKVEQAKMRKVIEVLKEVKVSSENGSESISISPSEGFSIGFEIDFADSLISYQKGHFDVKELSFKNDISRARTFGFVRDVDYLRSRGLLKGGSLDNAIVVDGYKVLNQEALRYEDEFVRHKILDCIGDTYLAGGHLKGHVKGIKSGHALNNKLLRELFNQKDAWRIIQDNNILQ